MNVLYEAYYVTSRPIMDELLQRIGNELQLPQIKREKASQTYNAIFNFLDSDEDLFQGNDIDVFPQGSYKIGTTVKPLSGEEYDLDIVLKIKQKWHSDFSPNVLLNKLYKKFRDSDRYADMVEKKRRCVRIKYAGDFHMDILPAYPIENIESEKLQVPDKQLNNWVPSAPRLYAKWFEDRCIRLKIIEVAQQEPLPHDLPFEVKPTLKRSVQLIKRHRDVYFSTKNDEAPKSIVLTTLAGMHYQDKGSLFDDMGHILDSILSNVCSLQSPPAVFNPIENGENFAESWKANSAEFRAFKEFVSDFANRWKTLSSIRGLNNISKHLEEMFGETVTKEALTKYSEDIQALREAERLTMGNATGNLSSVGDSELNSTTVRKNTFFGESR
jgi:hypothetical protein